MPQLAVIDLCYPLAARPGGSAARSACGTQLSREPLGGVAEAVIEPLSLIAEIAVGLAGFAGVAVMLGRGPGRWGAGDALRIRLLLTAAFTALFASLVATGSRWAGAGEGASVRLGAAALLIGQVYWTHLGRQIRRLEPSERALFSPRLAVVFLAVVFSSSAAQLIVLSGLARPAASWLFLYGLLACLAYAAFGFVRLLFVRPSSE